jgi:murein L,D-transpeptidase YafK
MIRRIVLLLVAVVVMYGSLHAQSGTSASQKSFIDYQKSFQRPNESINRKEAYLKNLFQLKGLDWPGRYVYIRSFKYDSEIEVWVKNSVKDEYKLLKIYKICALVGTLGPKRFEGDYQVPEGFYYINQFNPNSNYYLSLGLNYPNASDRILGDQAKPGGGIYIHGGCATVGCIPIKDDQIDELYVLCANAKSAGLDYIPVHVFPINYGVKKSYEYLTKLTKDNPDLKKFSDQMEQAFDYFEKYKQMPVVLMRDNGEYVIDNALPLTSKFQPKVRKVGHYNHVVRKIEKTADVVAKWPQFTGGMTAYDAYLKNLGNEMIAYLPENVGKAYVQVEFIVDKDGTPVNFKILKGLDNYFNEELLSRFEKMPKWEPAIAREAPVAMKMIQTVSVGAE